MTTGRPVRLVKDVPRPDGPPIAPMKWQARNMPRVRSHKDRRLAVADHAVARVAERAGAGFLDPEYIRRVVAETCLRAIARRKEEPHYVAGQTRVLVTILGVDFFAILGEDRTGWGRGRDHRAVVTALTPEQVAKREVGK